jgi:hypothetical protein
LSDRKLGDETFFMKIANAATTFGLMSLLCVACGKQDLRGSSTSSADGKTYLIVADDNGGQCGPIKVDGKIWPYSIGKAGVIAPGRHTIACGSEIAINIRPGIVYKFDYWGP